MKKNNTRINTIIAVTLAFMLAFSSLAAVPAYAVQNYNDGPYTSECGNISLYKTASDSSQERIYNVELKIVGQAEDNPVDVVLVIDQSGSMDEGSPTPMNVTKTAALAFVNKIFQNDESRIGIVGYSSPQIYDGYSYTYGDYYFNTQPSYDKSIRTALGLTTKDNVNTVNSTVNSMIADGGTDIKAGIEKAHNLLVTQGYSDRMKAIVVMSDGVANVGNWERKRVPLLGRKWFRVPAENWPNQQNAMNFAHTKLAVEAAASAKTSDIEIFSIGLLDYVKNYNNGRSYAIAQDTLRSIASSPANYYGDANTDNLTAIYEAIANSVSNAGTNAIVEDIVDDRFDIVYGSFAVDGIAVDENAINGVVTIDTNKITWNIGDIPLGEIILTYQVKAKDDTASNDENHLIPTNDYAKINYTSLNENEEEEDFPIPAVFIPALLIETPVSSIKIEKSGPGEAKAGDLINYTFDITNTGQSNLSKIKVYDLLINPENSGLIYEYEGILAPGNTFNFFKEYKIPDDYTEETLDNTARVEGLVYKDELYLYSKEEVE